MTIKKEFVQFEIPVDEEGFRYTWEDTDKTFDEAVEILAQPYTYNALRLVCKTFNDKTFKVDTKTICTVRKRNGELYWED